MAMGDDGDGDAWEKRNDENRRAYDELWMSSRGSNVAEVEHRLREFMGTHAPYFREADVVMQSRVMSDRYWGLKHPLGALAIAWKFRRVSSPRRTVRFFLRPRFAG